MQFDKYEEILGIFKSVPYRTESIYFNFHHECAYYFDGSEQEFARAEKLATQEMEPTRITEATSTDTYVNFEENKATQELISIRIRQYAGDEENGLTDLIALFKSEPGNENVLVSRIETAGREATIEGIIGHLNKFFKAEKAYIVTKHSKIVYLMEPILAGLEKTDKYLNISIDKIIHIQVDGAETSPNEILNSDKIIELEWNEHTPTSLVQRARDAFIEDVEWQSRLSPKLEKKSEIIGKWQKNKASVLVS